MKHPGEKEQKSLLNDINCSRPGASQETRPEAKPGARPVKKKMRVYGIKALALKSLHSNR